MYLFISQRLHSILSKIKLIDNDIKIYEETFLTLLYYNKFNELKNITNRLFLALFLMIDKMYYKNINSKMTKDFIVKLPANYFLNKKINSLKSLPNINKDEIIDVTNTDNKILKYFYYQNKNFIDKIHQQN